MDLLNEAVLRLLDGSRSRPPHMALVVVLATGMRGVAHDHWRKMRRERPVLVPSGDGADSAARQPDLSPTADPERVTAAVQALAEIDRLFAGDAVALQIIAGLAEGLAPEEIRRRFAIGGTAYDSAQAHAPGVAAARRRWGKAMIRDDKIRAAYERLVDALSADMLCVGEAEVLATHAGQAGRVAADAVRQAARCWGARTRDDADVPRGLVRDLGTRLHREEKP